MSKVRVKREPLLHEQKNVLLMQIAQHLSNVTPYKPKTDDSYPRVSRVYYGGKKKLDLSVHCDGKQVVKNKASWLFKKTHDDNVQRV